MRPLAVLRSLVPRSSRATRPAVPGGTRRDFFGDRLATFEELRSANALGHAPAERESVPAPAHPPVRHVA